MEDQVLGLKENGIDAEYLGSAQSQTTRVLDLLSHDKINLLYVTPEYITGGGSDILKQARIWIKILLFVSVIEKQSRL